MTTMDTVPVRLLFFSVVFKFIAMIIGVLGNLTVLIYTVFLNKEKTATSYLMGNLALADLLMCVTFYPIWIVEFIQTILNIDGDQDLFCALSRPTIWAAMFASVATLLAITIDRYLYIEKPLKYIFLVTRRRVSLVIIGIWSITLLAMIVLQNPYKKDKRIRRSYCDISNDTFLLMNIFIVYIPLTLIFLLNLRILMIARTQRKRVAADTTKASFTFGEQSNKRQLLSIYHFIRALKAVKTFAIVVVVLAFCVLTPTVVGLAIEFSCSYSCRMIWYVVIHYEFIGINSIVNAFIYGMRHMKYRKAYGNILFRIMRCNRSGN
ncbi:alpha-1B adrenergic receptor-like [Dendronephthya gigantea]|uniref:alpha-1B adrenergic receptor-like n=1 Tax=Dendronephthya gigantea TaxID=151771 RepID=UPI00106DBD72|nr:alpha-1B adrenergic receptor-like [Dendronephthya gigantea]